METNVSMPPPAIIKPNKPKLPAPHFASPIGLLAPKHEQPPPMFGPRGSTIPAKFLEKYKSHYEKYEQKNQAKKDAEIAKQASRNQQFWCENCDSQFRNKLMFDEHVSEFRHCTIDDCNFKGCSNSLDKHIEDLHVSGLYNKIKNLNTPEEIAKWREERRKRYPTTKNVLLRQKLQQEKRKRGEILEERKKAFASRKEQEKNLRGFQNDVKRKEHFESNTDNIKPKKQRRNNLHPNPKKNIVTENIVKNNSENNIFPKFRGTLSIPDYCSTMSCKPKKEKNVLSGILGMYGSSSESESESSDNEPNSPEDKNGDEHNNSNKNDSIVNDNFHSKFRHREFETSEAGSEVNEEGQENDNYLNSEIHKQLRLEYSVDDNRNDDQDQDQKLILKESESLNHNNLKEIISNYINPEIDPQLQTECPTDDDSNFTQKEKPMLKQLKNFMHDNIKETNLNTEIDIECDVNDKRNKTSEEKPIISEFKDLIHVSSKEINSSNIKQEMHAELQTENIVDDYNESDDDAPEEKPIFKEINSNLDFSKTNCNDADSNQKKWHSYDYKNKVRSKVRYDNIKETHLNSKINVECDVNDEGNDAPEEKPIIREFKNLTHVSSKEINSRCVKQKMHTELQIENIVNDCNESDEDAPEEKPILRENKRVSPDCSKETNRNDVDPNQKKLHSYDYKNTVRSKVRKVGSLLDYSKLRTTRQNTLLEKLLESQIRHERNVLLQCVRYVVKQNFFEIKKE